MAIKIIYEFHRGLYQIQDPDGGVCLSGSVNVDVISLTNITVGEDYSVGNESVIFVDATVQDVTLTLPPAREARGHVFHMKKIDSTGNYLIISGSNGQKIDGQLSQETNIPFTTLTITSNGSNYFIL